MGGTRLHFISLCSSHPVSYLEKMTNCESENIFFILPGRYLWSPTYEMCHKTCIK